MDKKVLLELMALDARLQEDRLYEIALTEIDTNSFDPVAKAKAFEEAEGDEQKAKSFYIKHRVRRIRDQMIAFDIEAEVTSAAKAEEAKQNSRDLNKLKVINTAADTIEGLFLFILIAASSAISFILFVTILVMLGAGDIIAWVASAASTFLLMRWIFKKKQSSP